MQDFFEVEKWAFLRLLIATSFFKRLARCRFLCGYQSDGKISYGFDGLFVLYECSYKQIGDAHRATATIAQHVPPLRVQLADAVSTPTERRWHPDAERARRVESIVSAPYE